MSEPCSKTSALLAIGLLILSKNRWGSRNTKATPSAANSDTRFDISLASGIQNNAIHSASFPDRCVYSKCFETPVPEDSLLLRGPAVCAAPVCPWAARGRGNSHTRRGIRLSVTWSLSVRRSTCCLGWCLLLTRLVKNVSGFGVNVDGAVLIVWKVYRCAKMCRLWWSTWRRRRCCVARE